MRRFVVLALGASLLDCRAPTELVVDVTTDIPCASLDGTSITVGRYPGIEELPPATVTTQCTSDGHIGSIVVVPAGAADSPVAVRVIGAKGQNVETCKAPAYGPPAPTPTGCVVARRLLSYEPHDPLYLPIVLRNVCVGVPCRDDQTCVDGTCKDATVHDPRLCSTPNTCGESTLGASDGGAPDAGEPDAGQPDAGEPDAGDGGPTDVDAGDGGPTDGGPDDAGDGGPTDTDAGDGGPDAGAAGPVLEVAASAQGTSCARTMSGRIYCWGSNDSGKLGIGGATANAKVPVTQVMPGIPDASGLGLAQSFMCVLSPSLGVLCAGNGSRGQLGSGVKAGSFTPSTVLFSSGAQSITVGANHACASQPPQILCWGAGTSGQLTSNIAGGNMDTATPGAFGVSQTGSLTVAAGGDSTCVIIHPGENVRCWGSNSDGQLDRDPGTTTSSSTPLIVNVSPPGDISVGTNAACALVGQQGQCWGRADGVNVTQSPLIPVSPTYSDIVQVALGGSGGCARRATGNVICWGANDVGQLGQGTTDTMNTYPPVDVPISDAVHIARSADHVCAAHADGTVSCWGDNTFGQVSGDGVPTTTAVTSPTTVPVPK